MTDDEETARRQLVDELECIEENLAALRLWAAVLQRKADERTDRTD